MSGPVLLGGNWLNDLSAWET